MKKVLSTILVLGVAAAVSAQNPLVFDFPKFTQPPVLDGVRGAAEWAGAIQLACSPGQIMQDGAQYGWSDIAAQYSVISANQLAQAPQEDAAEARTDMDYSAQIWQAWDSDGFYYALEVADNYRDVEGAGTPTNWWERDSMTLYIDLAGSKEQWDSSAGYVYKFAKMNLINYVAAPMNSSAVTRTWERLIQDTRTPTQDPDEIEGLEYGFSNGAERADYAIEGKIPWTTLLKYNLPAIPGVGTQMAWMWLAPDADGGEGYDGQIQCWGYGDNPASYTLFVFSSTPAGPGAGTAVHEDSWGRIKATF